MVLLLYFIYLFSIIMFCFIFLIVFCSLLFLDKVNINKQDFKKKHQIE